MIIRPYGRRHLHLRRVLFGAKIIAAKSPTARRLCKGYRLWVIGYRMGFFGTMVGMMLPPRRGAQIIKQAKLEIIILGIVADASHLRNYRKCVRQNCIIKESATSCLRWKNREFRYY